MPFTGSANDTKSVCREYSRIIFIINKAGIFVYLYSAVVVIFQDDENICPPYTYIPVII